MIRNCSLDEISDGNLYDINDMVKADCGDCQGCSDCCHDMGSSIILDPYDIYRMTTGMNKTFEQLMSEGVELNVYNGVILPSLKMTGANPKCTYLDADGRCSIHEFRPGICRLFPLGRYYEENDFKYFLQVNECSKKNRTKVKVKKWIDTPDLAKNKEFVLKWHDYIRKLETKVQTLSEDDDIKNANMIMLNVFYLKPYENEDFYKEFTERIDYISKI